MITVERISDMWPHVPTCGEHSLQQRLVMFSKRGQQLHWQQLAKFLHAATS
jgi:hypothetical protein